MRIRSIRPEFYDSESMGAVSWYARFVFECLWSYVQDNGVNRDNARMIRGTCMPYDGDDMIPRIEAALDELEAVGCIIRYEWRGKKLLWLPNFLTYQQIARPSKCLFPTPEQLEDAEDSMDTRETQSNTHEPSLHTHDTLMSDRCTFTTGVGVGVGDRSEDISSSGGGSSKSTLTRAHAREAATASGDDARREEALLEAWLPTSDDLAHAASLGVDGKTLADKMRDKLTRKGFDACGIHRRTPQALDAMFRTWVEHEAQWAKEKPKQVKPPDPVHVAPPRHSWCGPEVRAIMTPYRDRFPEPGPGDAGPGQAWFEACRDVAQRLDDGEDEASIIEWLEANYGTQTTSNVSNDP